MVHTPLCAFAQYFLGKHPQNKRTIDDFKVSMVFRRSSLEMLDFLLFFIFPSLPTPQNHCPAARSSHKASFHSCHISFSMIYTYTPNQIQILYLSQVTQLRPDSSNFLLSSLPITLASFQVLQHTKIDPGPYGKAPREDLMGVGLQHTPHLIVRVTKLYSK